MLIAVRPDTLMTSQADGRARRAVAATAITISGTRRVRFAYMAGGAEVTISPP